MSSCPAADLSSFALSGWKYVVEGVLTVELSERHGGVIRIFASHHYVSGRRIEFRRRAG